MNKKKKGILKQEPGVPEYQIELEMQNEEMRRAQLELNIARARYFDLYNNAPVCYVTVSEAGLILQANLTAATLLGVTQADLVRQPLPRFIQAEDADSYHLLCKKLLATRETQECELRLVKSGGAVLWAHLTATVAMDEEVPVIRIVLSDVTGQKKAEEALHESAELYRSIVQTAEEGIWKINAASLTDYVNPKMAQMMGYKPEEMLGRPIDDFLDDEGRAMLANLIERRKNGITEQFEFKYIRKDGSELWAFVSTNPITNAKGVYVGAVALLTDISARRAAEAALTAEKTRLRTVLDLLPISIYVKDTQSRFVVVNKGAAEALGATSCEEMIGKTDADYFPPAIAAIFREDEKRVLAGEPAVDLEESIFFPDGTARTELTTKVPLCNENGEIIGLVGASRDITANKRVEAAWRRADQQLRLHFEQSPMAIIEWDLEFKVTSWNHAAGTIFGYSSEEALGSHASFIVPKAYRSQVDQIWQALVKKSGGERSSNQNERKDGTTIYCEWYNTPLIDDGGRVTGVASLVHDITERKRAEDALKASFEFRDNLIRSMPDGFSVLDANGVQLEVNPALCQMTGFSRGELVGKIPPFPYWPPEEYENIGAAFQKTLAGNLGDLELIFLRKNGERFPVIVSPSVIKNSNGETVNYLATVKDITVRKQAEAALHETEERYRLLADNTDDIVGLNDTKGNRLYISPSYFRKTGWTPEELDSKHWRFRIHPDDIGTVEQARLQNLAGIATLIEHRTRCKDGSWLWCETSCKPLLGPDGKVWRLLVWSHDITARRKAEAEMQQSEERYRLLADNTDDIVGLNDSEGNRLYVSPSFYRKTGWTPEEVLKTDWRSRVHPEDIAHTEKARLVSAKGTSRSVEYRILCRDGSWLWVSTSYKTLPGTDGKPWRLLIWSHDITARKKAEASLRESEEKFRTLFETASDAIFLLQGNQFIDCNASTLQIFGCQSRDQIVGHPPYEFSPAVQPNGRDSSEFAIEKITAALSGKPQFFEWTHTKMDGTPFPAEVTLNALNIGGQVLLQAIVRDISQRKKAEKDLRENEQQFRAIFEQAAVGVAMIDSNTGRFLRVNQRAYEIARLTKEEMLHETFMDITHPDDLQPDLDQMEQLKKGKISTFTMEKRYLHPDGVITWINLTVSPMWSPGETPTRHIAVVEDITARKQIELELAHTADLLLRTGEIAKIGGWEIDMRTQKLTWSLETSRLFEMDTPEAPSVEEAINYYAPEARPIIRAAVNSATEKGTPYDLELRVISAKGRHFWARSQGAPVFEGSQIIKLIGTFQDISGRKEADIALRESEAKFRAIFDQAAVGVAIRDSFTGKFLNINDRYCEIIGLSRKKILERSFFDFVHPDDLKTDLEHMQNLREGKVSHFTMEKRYLRAKGPVVWVSLTVSPLWKPGEAPNHHIAVVEDITDRKIAEAKYLRELKFNETLVDHTAVIIVLLDRQGRMEHVNQATVDILGYSRKELLGRTPWAVGLMGPEEKLRALERLKVLLKAGGSNPPRETILKAKDGKPHVFSLSSVSTSTLDGTVDRIIVTGADLTERNRLQREVLKISEQEQARIGHNLHDGIGQTMTGVASLMEALESELNGEQRTSAARIRQLVQDAIQEVRRMSHSMSPAAVKNRGLDGVLQLLADTIRINHRTACTCKIDPGIRIGDAEKETHIYRIAQEAANNAIRHGKPTKITISLRHLGEKGCVLKIEDNGSGFKKTKAKASEGIGLQVMDYRANLIGGTLKIASKPRRGVTVTCRFPCAPSKA